MKKSYDLIYFLLPPTPHALHAHILLHVEANTSLNNSVDDVFPYVYIQ